MDDFLNNLGAYRSDIAKDETCVCRVVSEKLYHTQAYYLITSKKLTSFIRRNYWLFESELSEGEDINTYLRRAVELWPGLIEMKALSSLYSIRFLTFCEPEVPPQEVREVDKPHATITLAGFSRNRFDFLYHRDDISIYSICQSIIYELLYKDVFSLGEDVDMAVDKMLHDKNYSKQRKQIQSEGHEDLHLMFDVDEEPEKVVKKALAQGIPPFPYKIAKNLDTFIYRNVEFDIWNEERRAEMEEQYTPVLGPGVKCWLLDNGNNVYYVAYVQELLQNDMASVYVERFGQKRNVHASNLRPIPIPMTQAFYAKYHSGFRKENPSLEKRKNKKFYKKAEDELDIVDYTTPVSRRPMTNDSGYGTNSSSKNYRKRSESGPKNNGSYIQNNYRPRSFSASYNTKPKMLSFTANECNRCNTPAAPPPPPPPPPPQEWNNGISYRSETYERLTYERHSTPNYVEKLDESPIQSFVYPTYSSPVPTAIYPIEYPDQRSYNAVSLPIDIPNAAAYNAEPRCPDIPIHAFITESNVPYFVYPSALNFETQSTPIPIPAAPPTASFIINSPPNNGISPQWVPYPPSNGVSSWPLPTVPIYQRLPLTPVMNGYTIPVQPNWVPPTNFHTQVVPNMSSGLMMPVAQFTCNAPCPGIPPPVPAAQYFAATAVSYPDIEM